MAEKTLNDPLADFEIKDIICAEIRKRLDGDCTLMGGQAYAGFTAKFEVKIAYTRSLTPPTLVWGTAKSDPPDNVTVELIQEKTVASDTYASVAPNVERQEHNLPIPVLVQTPTGAVRRRVHVEKAKQ